MVCANCPAGVIIIEIYTTNYLTVFFCFFVVFFVFFCVFHDHTEFLFQKSILMRCRKVRLNSKYKYKGKALAILMLE